MRVNMCVMCRPRNFEFISMKKSHTHDYHVHYIYRTHITSAHNMFACLHIYMSTCLHFYMFTLPERLQEEGKHTRINTHANTYMPTHMPTRMHVASLLFFTHPCTDERDAGRKKILSEVDFLFDTLHYAPLLPECSKVR